MEGKEQKESKQVRRTERERERENTVVYVQVRQ